MLRSSPFSACAAVLSACLVAAPAGAVSVLDVLSGSDGNFLFSVIHTSTGGSDGQSGSVIGDIALGPDGGTWSEAAGVGTLEIELVVDAAGSLSSYDAVGSFDLAALTDFTAQADVMLGSLQIALSAGLDETGIDGLTFYFEDRNYSSATSPPNGLSGDLLTLWGATVFTGSGNLGEALDLSPGGRGIDLRVQLSPPIPEPSARPLYLAGLAVVGLAAWRMRRS